MVRRKRDGIFCWLFSDGAGDDVVGHCVGLGVVVIMTASDIDDIQLNESSSVSCKLEIYSLL